MGPSMPVKTYIFTSASLYPEVAGWNIQDVAFAAPDISALFVN